MSKPKTRAIVRLGRGMEYALIIQRGKGRNAEFIAGVHFADKPTRRELRQWRDAIQRGIEPNATITGGAESASNSSRLIIGRPSKTWRPSNTKTMFN